ncbi:MAG: TIGR03013 family XrtA/PEP-CTERM system glycosyltransferase [Thermodesulfobacteriota bacterium]
MQLLLHRLLNPRHIFLVFVEGFLLFVVLLLLLFFRFNILVGTPMSYSIPFKNSVLVMIVYLISFHYWDLYHPDSYSFDRQMFNNLCVSLIASSVFLFVLYYLYPPLTIGRGVLMANVIVSPVVVIGWRAIYIRWLSGGLPSEQVLIMGSGNLAKKIATEILAMKEMGLHIVGFVDDDPSKIGKSIVNPTVLGGYADLWKIVRSLEVDRVIVALPDRRQKLPMAALLKCKLWGARIEEGETFQERVTGKVPLDQLRPSWLVFSQGFKSLGSRKVVKRIADIIFSISGLILSSPLLLIVPILIKLDSHGSVIFKQKRVGENNKLYTLYKFRSMRQDAEAETGPVWAKEKDDRVTKVGRILRVLRIDEIPQIINVLKGDMSFIGPRPERPYFVVRLKKEVPYYGLRLMVKPGITGWAQVKYSYGASVKDALEKLQYDLYYIKNMSLLFDLIIFMKTIKIMLLGKGAR